MVSPIKCRPEVRFCASLVHVENIVLIPRFFKAFFSVRLQVMRGRPLGLRCATRPAKGVCAEAVTYPSLQNGLPSAAVGARNMPSVA